ncbi:MAG: hypothetical protein J7500_07870 [Sphingomonas sp.]|uniref:hypothetical protein n=1 Tax=Sphingomonas sp. TaxID=28214 RepID=UPI001B06BE34|nr:hypothetical protein [Sphingomonas sp.]MBO9622614.1 hypothetical protein [Sphingomonas sp.]
MAEIASAGLARRIAVATLVAGTLDIAMAAIDTAAAGRPIANMLRAVASGPFPAARTWGAAGAATGLLVHFAIMAVMATVFLFAHARIARVRAHPLLAGALYGVVLWLVMYGLVLPLRFGAPFPSTEPVELAKQLFAHIVLVGLSFGLVARTRRA